MIRHSKRGWRGWTVMFTGHRPDKLGGYEPNPTQDWCRKQIDQTILNAPKGSKFITGMALGIDQWVAEACIKLDRPFIAAVPFPSQSRVWPEKSREHYLKLLKKVYKVVQVSDRDPGDSYEAALFMQRRNEWGVDRCDELVAFWDGSSGGTANTVKYAEKVGRTITRWIP